jgi:hypothetical protein
VENLSFTNTETIIDGHNSKDLGIDGLMLVRIGESEISTPWIGGKSIIEDTISNRDIPTFYGVQKQPLEFEMKFSLLQNEFTPEHLFQLGKIFGQDRYFPIQSVDYLGVVFWVMATNQINIITYGNFAGWYSVNLRCNAPFGFSLPQISTFDLSDITSPTTIMLENRSNVMNPKFKDYYYEPEIWIDLKSNSTAIKMLNASDKNRLFEFTQLNLLEEIYVNNRLQLIESSTGLNRLGKLTNHNFFRLIYGQNLITVYNPCVIQVKSEFPLYI